MLAHLSLAALALAWVIPFLEPRHFYPLASFYSEWEAMVLGLAALVLLATKRAWHDGLPAIMLAPLALAALILVQAALGHMPYFGQAWTPTLYLVWAALLIALGAALKRELGMTKVVSTLAWCLVIGGELSSMIGILQYYDISTVFDPLIMPKIMGRTHGNFGQPNHFANYTALALISVAYLFASGRMRSVFAAAVATPLVFALGLSLSRSAWLYLAAAFVLALLLYGRHRDDKGRQLVICGGLTLLAFALDQWLMALPWFAPAAFAPDASDVSTATQRILSQTGMGITIKWQHVRTAWWTFMHAPFLGVGWGQFPWYDFEFKALYGEKYPLGVTTHAHNLITQLLAETGLAGTLLVTGGILLWLRDLRAAKLDLDHWWLFAVLVTIGIHSMLEFPLWYANFLGVAAVSLGLGATPVLPLRLQRIAPPAAALLLAVGFLNAFALWHDYREFERLFGAGPSSPLTDQMAAMVARGQYDPVLEPYVELAIMEYVLVNRDELQDKLDVNSRVMHFRPGSAVVYRQALLLALNGQAQEAHELFARAMRIYPADLSHITGKLRKLVVYHPAEYEPLLELATAKAAEQRAPHAVK